MPSVIMKYPHCGGSVTKTLMFDKNGKAARGGEFPIEALPQALEFAIRNGYITL